jgi:transcriptional regulator with XRE-family HTH domain
MTTPVRVTTSPVDGVIEEIRVAMVRRKMTQHSLAQRVGEGDPWVHRRLTGRAEITLKDLYRIADALGVDVRTLLPEQSTERYPRPHLWFPPRRSLLPSAERRPVRLTGIAA